MQKSGRTRTVDDVMSLALGVGGLVLPLYFMPQTLANLNTFAILCVVEFLGLVGFALRRIAKPKDDDNLTVDEALESGKWTIALLIIFAFASAVIPAIPLNLMTFFLELSPNDQMLFAIMFAINEESFFRGGVLELLYWKMPNKFPKQVLASLGSGALFVWFHVYVYGWVSPDMAFVWVAGFSLGWVVLKSKRLTPAYLAHIINNIAVVLG